MLLISFAIKVRAKVHDIDKAHIVHTRLIRFSFKGKCSDLVIDSCKRKIVKYICVSIESLSLILKICHIYEWLI
jgi:hypothetical protein